MAKADTSYRFNYFLICDDIRREDNGKEILIGVYNDEILVQSLPILLASLHFRLSLYPKNLSLREFGLSVTTPTGANIVKAEGQLIGEHNRNVQSIINVAAKPLMLPELGAYSVRFRLGKGKEMDVGRFVVRHPTSDAESARIPK